MYIVSNRKKNLSSSIRNANNPEGRKEEALEIVPLTMVIYKGVRAWEKGQLHTFTAIFIAYNPYRFALISGNNSTHPLERLHFTENISTPITL